MGFFNSFKKKANSALGLGKNNDLLSVGAGVMTGGLTTTIEKAEQGKLKDMFLGKKAKDIKPDSIANQIRATQTKGLGELNSALDTPAANIIGQQNELQKSGIVASAQDARRNAQKMIAQRGLQNSSLGLMNNRAIDQQSGNDIAAVNAALPGQIRNQSLQDAQMRISAGNINQNGMNFNTIQGQRSGGILGIAGQLAPIAGTIAGAAYGGPAGAAAGGQAGQGVSAMVNSQQNPNYRNTSAYA